MLVERGHKPFRTKQLWQWLYWHGVTDFDAMTNLSKDFRQLADEFVIERPQVSEALNNVDGTAKWLLKFPDGNEVETVHIPEADRGTLCVSSQVGCTLTCKFCHTGTQRLVRNLTAAEVVGQMMLARDAFGEWPTSDHSRMITNVVMMGMGEPLCYDNVAAAPHRHGWEGLSLSKRRPLSTSGVVPAMRKCGEELNVNLAVSLHAVDDDTRDHIVPINKVPMEELLDACRTYPGVTNARRITFEYVMLKGVNDSDADARQLVRLLKGIPSKINLIPFNPWPGSDFECSSATDRRVPDHHSGRRAVGAGAHHARKTSSPPAASSSRRARSCGARATVSQPSIWWHRSQRSTKGTERPVKKGSRPARCAQYRTDIAGSAHSPAHRSAAPPPDNL